ESFMIETHSSWGGGGTSQKDTVDVSPTTTYFQHGVEKPTLANVKVGEIVVLFGKTEGTTVTASKVAIFTKPSHHEQPATAGVVLTEPSGESFTIESGHVGHSG